MIKKRKKEMEYIYIYICEEGVKNPGEQKL